ncbi:putative membrane-associated Zn-dependent proteases 1 [[Synechococcus] sp. NIES-970]|uniref:site-2 protease family protein n=1 Tax=Picosynechococcus sp. NKBG15041c TaxID=1407650 RepID=UPI0003FF2280|nr:site-2 protease family protein [Picosynechococcus sp. NKBG15041c]BAW97309.1 putative membrane-associated Zn-dependent proteases 1 [[Synechococcus] sp. NIES-970]
MEVWLLFLIMGVITYVLIRRTVPPENKAPLGLLWLVMMLPASAWLVWILVFGATQPMPLIVMLPLLVVSPVMYWSLLDWGKPKSGEVPGPKEATPPQPPNLETLEQSSSVAKEADATKLRPISTQEEEALRGCFPWGMYYLQTIDYHPQAILCRGKLRAVPQEAYQTIRDNIEKLFGDRFIVVFQESLRGQPFFALVPNYWQTDKQNQGKEEPLTRPDLAIALVLISLFTTTVMGLELQGIAPEAIQQDPRMLWQGLPYGLLLVGILGLHELGHYGAALYYKIKTTLPYFVPIPFFIGTLGAYTQRKTPIPHRQALFDFAAAGSWIGMLLTLPCLWIGLGLSQVVPMPEETTLLTFNEFDPRFSLLLGLMSRLALGSDFTPEMAVNLHPVAIAGYVALMLGGLQLLPIGQLDGGLITHAVFGQRTAGIIAQVTRIFMIAIAFVQPNFVFLAIFALLMPIANQPALNDVTDLDNRRDLLGMLTLVFVALIFLPLPAGLSAWLNF